MLEALLERPGEVVDRGTLRQRLWPEDHHVDVDGGINAAVRRLREVLGDSASNPRFVVTVPRRGYRFIAPVEVVGDESTVAKAQPTADGADDSADAYQSGESAEIQDPRVQGDSPRTPMWAWGIAALGLVAILVSVFDLLSGRLAGSTPREPVPVSAESSVVRLAVLPFATRTPDPNRAFLGDAVTDELIVRLGRLAPEQLQVIARASVQGFRDGAFDLATVARQLDVDFVLEGSVQQERERLRIHVALVATERQHQMWSRTFEREIGDLLTFEREIAEHVAQKLALELEMTGESQAAKGRSHELYLEGQHFLQQLGENDLRIALRSFDEAVREDPQLAEAYAGSALAWVLMATFDFADASQAFDQARDFADRALSIDPDSARGTLVSALVHELHLWNFDAAEPLFQRALELDPGSPYTLLFAAAFESNLGRQERALELAHRALDLDPLSSTVNAQVCWRWFYARDFDRADARCRRAIELAPSFLLGWDTLKWVHIRQGHVDAASDFLRVVELEGDYIDQIAFLQELASREGIEGLLRISVQDPERRLAASGQSPFNLALDFAALGQAAPALHWLELAYDARESDLVSVAVDPRLDVLRDEPRFQDLLERMGLDRVDSGAPAPLQPLP